jgi:hypothetical protein
VLFITLFIAVIGLGPRLLNVDGDLGRHLAVGKYILTTRLIPIQDLFSHTMAGEPLTPHEWLAQLVFAMAYSVGELDGVVVFCALLIAAIFTILFRQCYQRSGMLLVGMFFTILAATASSLHWLPRPHLFTLLLLTLWVGELEGLRQGIHHRWWALPLIMLIWANAHGAFIAGFVVWGIYLVGSLEELWAGKRSIRGEAGSNKNLLLILYAGLLSFGASLINPVGLGLWKTSLDFLKNGYLVGHTVEYLPPNFQHVSTWPFLVMILLSILLFGLSKSRRSLVSILMVAAWTAMGLVSARNIPLYAIVTAPILASAFASLVRESRMLQGVVAFDDRISVVETRLHAGLWPLLIVGVLILAYYSRFGLESLGARNRFSPEVFPVQAIDWMKAEQVSGPGFNYFPWGGYILYRTWPDQRVFIDGQTDFYGEDLTRQYETVLTQNTGWRQVLADYRVRWVLMPVNADLVKALKSEDGWRIRYQDPIAVVLVYEP